LSIAICLFKKVKIAMFSVIEKEYAVLGVNVNAFTVDSLNELVKETISCSKQTIIAHHNLHSVYLYQRVPEFMQFYDVAQYAHIDGMPLVMCGKLIGYDLQRQNRITYMDWISSLLGLMNENSYKVFYLGSKKGVAEKAISEIGKSHPNIVFEMADGYFNVNSEEENSGVVAKISKFKPDILMVGMGMPRQEIWIKNNWHAINATVILPCGACFDYLAGEVRTPPRWMGQYNLEWLYRFIFEPKRLFRRYFYEPIALIPLLVKDLKSRSSLQNSNWEK
jgi:N-acetylglucosaminyldiphosphoundecaprenol N-acetyl-beta-D-mannosaminyltransferase